MQRNQHYFIALYKINFSGNTLLGFTKSSIRYKRNLYRWELKNGQAGLVAHLEYDFKWPIGVNSWTFENEFKCVDDDQTGKRRLNLYTADIQEPRNFCCHDGHCIDSEHDCDSILDCQDGQTMEMSGYKKVKGKPGFTN